MWFVFALLHGFLMAVVNYIDEYLTTKNTVSEDLDIHTKIGGLILISTLLSLLGAGAIWAVASGVSVQGPSLVLALASAIPMVGMWIGYFYLLLKYPVYQVTPLFLMSSIWLLLIELLFGGSAGFVDIAGIFILLVGAYFLDAGSFKWQIPTRLMLISIPATTAWAIALFMVRIAAGENSAIAVTFWQYLGIGLLGMMLFAFVKNYRDGFLYRIHTQGRKFIGISLLNESASQGSFLFGNLAVAAAPLAAYVTGMSGVQSIFLLLLFIALPINKQRVKITRLHVVSIMLIVVGVLLIEGLGKA